MWNVRRVSCVPGSPMRLRRDDADGLADLDQAAGGVVHAVALGADALARLAGQNRAGADHLDARGLDLGLRPRR